METQIEDFPFVAELPKREVKKARSRWEEIKFIYELVKEKGMPVPQRLAGECLGVSRQRVNQWINEGRLETMNYGGVDYVTHNSLTFLAQQVRKTGRPAGGQKVA